jgi:hypothetical protein
LDPLDKALSDVRNILLTMEEKKHLHIKYIIEQNTGLHDAVIHMVK